MNGNVGVPDMNYQPKKPYGAILLLILVISIGFVGCTGYQQSPGPATTPPTQVPGTTTVTIQNFAFSPPELTVSQGATVTWVNKDAADHQIVSDASGADAVGNLFKSPILPKDGSFTFTFTTPGTYPYHCSIHPSMKGSITVQ
ncbi:MAG TPA: cupredoxin domain-containing protein [Methanoregulaceae archaeon]|nr:cupredoxin domain-containing protein [Methanoregulaceae archaeon]